MKDIVGTGLDIRTNACTYDHMGRRATKKVTTNGAVTLHQRYLYRGYLQIACCDLKRSGHPCLWLLTWDPTQAVATRPLALRKDGTWYCYGWDLTKNICEVYKTNGGIGTAYTYSPYGSVTATGAITQPIQWSSEYADTELGLTYYNYRHYNPSDGRWLRRDIAAGESNGNPYQFVENAPLSFSDLIGLRRTVMTDKNTCTIHIVLPIVISPQKGDDLDANTMQEIAAKVKKAIEKEWSGFPYGCCTVQVTANVSIRKRKRSLISRLFHPRTNHVEITSADNHRSYVSGGKGGLWWSDAEPYVYAHEAGHLMGLPDDYNETEDEEGNPVTTPKDGHKGHLMAQYGGKVDQHEIKEILKGIKCPCDEKN